jgi:hypothetical protein
LRKVTSRKRYVEIGYFPACKALAADGMNATINVDYLSGGLWKEW